MNMNRSPTIDQLRELFRSYDESSGHSHVLWVSKTGDVVISIDRGGVKSPPICNARLCYEMFSPLSDQVGHSAANDTKFMNRIFKSLQERWSDFGDPDGEMVYVDQF